MGPLKKKTKEEKSVREMIQEARETGDVSI